jgi:hypothetical protein
MRHKVDSDCGNLIFLAIVVIYGYPHLPDTWLFGGYQAINKLELYLNELVQKILAVNLFRRMVVIVIFNHR